MPPAPPRYDRRRLAEAAGLPAEAVEVVASIDSTSTALLQRAFGPLPAPARVLVAVEQTAGRGRRGRAWLVAADRSMTLSVALERALDAQARPHRALPLALGVALAEKLEAFGCALGLKWPNDLQRDGRKVAGLLVEARVSGGIERVVVGLGLNLLPDAALEAALEQPIGALFAPPEVARAGDGDAPRAVGAHGPPLPDRSVLAGALAGTIVRTCARNAADGFEPFRAGWQARDALAAGVVRILEPDGSGWDGEAVGIDEDGALLVRTPDGTHRVLAADVSVRARLSHAKTASR